MSLDQADIRTLTEAVADFTAGRIAPLVAVPEMPSERESVTGALTELIEMGVLNTGDEVGFGVWDSLEDPAIARLSTYLIAEVAKASPSIAHEVHVRAIALHLNRLAGDPQPNSSVTFEASAGVGGRATARSLVDMSEDGDTELLADLWGPPVKRPRLHIGPPEWEHLWFPVWTEEEGWFLRRSARRDASTTELHHHHGFDETRHLHVNVKTIKTKGPTLDRNVLVDAFAADAIGLLAMSAATARRAIDRARDYSVIRRQGGTMIGQHDAVAQLLSTAEHAVQGARAQVDALVEMPAGIERLNAAWRARALHQPLLSAAGSSALQVFGGIGYMRDLGAEKDQRDLNTFRRLSGSPTELTLRCAALDDAGRKR